MRATALVGGIVTLGVVAASVTGCHGGSKDSSADAASSISVQPGPPPSAPANATPMSVASVEAYVNPTHLPAYDGPTGSIEGTIRVDGPPAGERKGFEYGTCRDAQIIYGKKFREGAAAPDGTRALADAIVVVTGYTGFYIPERNDTVKLSVDGCSFSARTMALTFGQQIEISSTSKDMWAPTLAQAPLPALMVVNSNTAPVKLYPPHPGYFTIADTTQSHKFATVDVYALLQPLHTVSDIDGHYRIDGVPVGKMRVNARLNSINHDVSSEVEVQKGAVAHVDLVMHQVPAAPVLDSGMDDRWKK